MMYKNKVILGTPKLNELRWKLEDAVSTLSINASDIVDGIVMGTYILDREILIELMRETETEKNIR